MLFLLLVRGSSAKQGAAIFWQLLEMSGLLGEVYTELYRVVHRALSAIRNNRMSTVQGEVYTGRIGPIVGTLESVRIIKMSAFQWCPQGGVPLYYQCYSVCMYCNYTICCTNSNYRNEYWLRLFFVRLSKQTNYL